MPPTTIPPYLDDPVFYADMIDAIGRGATVLADSPTGVMLRTPCRSILITADDAATTEAMLDQVDHPVTRAIAHDDHCVPVVKRRLGLQRATQCYGSVYPGTDITPVTVPGARVAPLGPEWAPFVADNYPLDPPYAFDRVEAGAMLGAFVGDTLAGFIGRHTVGSMGLLVILPEFRRHGLATVLVTHLIHDVLATGRVPYGHTVPDNAASLRLQHKLGFTISKRTLYWMC